MSDAQTENVNLDVDQLEFIQKVFQEATGSATTMGLDQFTKLMTSWGVPSTYCRRYFAAFDKDSSGAIDAQEFLLGLCALDPNAQHGSDEEMSDARLEYIFKTYDLNGDGHLELEELTNMIRHIRRARGEDTSAKAVTAEARQATADIGGDGTYNLDQFKKAVRALKFPGTSSLFRLPSSILKNIHGDSGAGPSIHEAVASLRRSLNRGAVDQSGRRVQFFPKVVMAKGGQVHVGGHEGAVFNRANEIDPNLLPATEQSHAPSTGPVGLSIAEAVIDQLLLARWQEPTNRAFDVVTAEELCTLATEVANVLRSEPALYEMPAPAKVFGDIHGQFLDLLEFFQTYGSPNHRTGDIRFVNYIFVGDFVDRGCYSLEVVSLLFSLKLKYNERVCLVRGNHEDRYLNEDFGFRTECLERFGEENGEVVWEMINDAFDLLPIACRLEERILCIHGGIGSSITRLSQLSSLNKPIIVPDHIASDADRVVMDALWSDPTQHDRVLGVHPSNRGENIVAFGPDRVMEFCRDNDLDLVIRAHECVDSGYEFFADGHLITLFSATNYCGKYDNDGAIAEVSLENHGKSIKVRQKIIRAKPFEVAATLWSKNQARPPTPPRGRVSEPAAYADAPPVVSAARGRKGAPPALSADVHESGVVAQPIGTTLSDQQRQLLDAVGGLDVADEDIENVFRYLTSAGMTVERIDEARKMFASGSVIGAGGAAEMDLAGFTQVMVPIGVEQKYCRQYFSAMSNGKQSVNFTQFLLGLVALDPETEHAVDEISGDRRLDYIFGVYDINTLVPGNGHLDKDELRHMIRHLRRNHDQSVGNEEVERDLTDSVQRMSRHVSGGSSNDITRYNRDDFKSCVRSLVLRGTSTLFRIAQTPFMAPAFFPKSPPALIPSLPPAAMSAAAASASAAPGPHKQTTPRAHRAVPSMEATISIQRSGPQPSRVVTYDK